MNKPRIQLTLLILLSLHGGFALADSGRFAGSFWGLGKNNAEGREILRKEPLTQRRPEKSAGRNNERRSGLSNQELKKDLSKHNSENLNAPAQKNRLTPDERRALRRQIHDAGNDLDVPAN